MRRFDCLSRDCPIFGPHLLEASAGTGKTFSIEHIFTRLLLEDEPIELEQILAVTFTRAATRELKSRIGANLDRAIHSLRSAPVLEYLQPFAESEPAIRRLSDARCLFDRCQIFTIHGFCFRMLREFAFEANLGFSVPDPDRARGDGKRLRRAVREFLENSRDLPLPEQLSFLLKDFDSIEELIEELLRSPRQETTLGKQGFFDALRQWRGAPIEEKKLRDDFHSLAIHYKSAIKGDFEGQLVALAKSFLGDETAYRTLLKEKGSIFDFFAPSNRKVRASLPQFLHYPQFFEWAGEVLGPPLRFATQRKNIFRSLASHWQKTAEKLFAQEVLFNPDDLLHAMKKALDRPAFVERLQQKYRAVIIDEFQDTDPLQWEIFRRIFLEARSLRALYLVGDPKQSIYRFRSADVYTYFKARADLGEGALYSLDVNFRSSKELLSALNALFDRNWFTLPKAGRTIPYTPLQAGGEIRSDFGDGKGALHAIVVQEDSSSFEEAFLPYAIQEIERLMPREKRASAFAILVKDRYQAETALSLLRERGIPAFAKNQIPLGQTFTFQAIRELFDAIVAPRDLARGRILQAGPFAHLPPFDLDTLSSEGLIPFFRRLSPCDLPDFDQIAEEFLLWEQREGFSIEGLFRFIKEFETLDADQEGRRRIDTEEEAVQILTLHISKGLEFEVVFALGLATPPPEASEEVEEIDAEKLRQLYVAMTRAKRRLYFPVVLSSQKEDSPMALFCRCIESKEGSLLSYFKQLSQKESFTFEEISCPYLLPPTTLQKAQPPSPLPPPKPVPFLPSYIYSFTTLAKPKEQTSSERVTATVSTEFSIHTMPKGAETGILIHHVFERLFSAQKPIWRDRAAVCALIADEVRFSSLAPWQAAIEQAVQGLIHLPLDNQFSLHALEPQDLQVEMEFLYSTPPHFVKGFIDLVFCWRGKTYFLDWKTNWLGDTDVSYGRDAIQQVMDAHDYWLQAALYAEALCRYLKGPLKETFGGAYYLFIRGHAFCHFLPDQTLLGKSDDN